MNLGIMYDPEKFIPVSPAERDLRLPDGNAFTTDAADLIHHNNERLVHPDIFPRRQPFTNGFHT